MTKIRGRKRQSADKRKIHFLSLGCPKNRVDTEVMAGIAVSKGLEITPNASDADIIAVNTCAFIESAKEESIEAILEMARHRKEGKCGLLIAAGCLCQRYGRQLAEEIPELDHILGSGTINRIGDAIDGLAPRVAVSGAAHFLQGDDTHRFVEPGSPFAYVKIADGCSRRCSFCAIPSIRGKARSRPIQEIAKEAELLAEHGAKEIVLVAQDTTAFGRDRSDGADLVKLLCSLNDVRGISWIRLLYLYPESVVEPLLEAVRDLPKVVPYLDVPIQHSSASMLRRMRRGHGPATLRRMVERAREIVPGIFLRTTVLVGHPGETDEEFADLVEFLKWAKFDHLGVFRYSDEEGTASHLAKPKVTSRTSYDRQRKVSALARCISAERNRSLKGTTVEVLIEEAADDCGFVLAGRHAGQAPEIDGVTYVVSCGAKRGEMVKAKVTKTKEHDLVAEPI